jgi:hypothetical protein
MERARIGAAAISVALFATWPASAARGDGSPDAVTVRVVRPDEQLERVIGLFRGAKAKDPAAALAGWKHATGGAKSLGKPLEAAIAALNPAMIPELRGLDETRLTFGFDQGTGRLHWRSVVPHDDGSLAALRAALALTDGAADEPIGEVTVLRLGPPGSALSVHRADRAVFASNRVELRAGLESDVPVPSDRFSAPGWHLQLDPAGLRAISNVDGKRLSEALDAIGCKTAEAWTGLDNQTLSLSVTTRHAPALPGGPAIEPTWLAAIPAEGVLAACTFALGTEADALAGTFAVLDRVERADPARAGVAPLRTRLNLIASAARVRPEIDLWPNLRGFTVVVLVDPGGETRGALLSLHATSVESAARIAGQVLPRLVTSLTRAKPPEPGPAAEPNLKDIRRLGVVDGKPLAATTRGTSVLIGWGRGSLEKGLDALSDPSHSEAETIRRGWGASPPQRAGALWPGLLKRVSPPDSPLARALHEAPPVVWRGWTSGETSRDEVRWTQLDAVIRRWLEMLPLETPDE